MEKFFTEIRNNVEKEAEQLLSRAKRVAEREIKYAKIEAEQILSDYIFDMEKRALILEKKEIAHNIVNNRKIDLEQKQQFVNQIFKLMIEEIKNIPRNQKYEAWIKYLLIIALKNFNDKNVVVYSAKKDAEIVLKVAEQFNVKCSDEFLDVEGGIVLKSADNRMTIDLSARAVLNSKKDDLRSKIIPRIQN